MIILGIDPGLAITGYGLIEVSLQGNRQTALIEAGVLRSSNHQPVAGRLKEIYDQLVSILKEFSPQFLAMEEVYSSQKFPRSGLQIGNVQGIVFLAAEQHKIPVHTYFPIQVKKSLIGYGRANKMQVQKMVQDTFKLKSIPRPDDAADALAIALCHAGRARGNFK